MTFSIVETRFSLYPVVILVSFVCAVLFLNRDLKHRGVSKLNRLLFCFLSAVMAVAGSKMLTVILAIPQPVSFLSAGMSSYGGAAGVIGAALIYEKIESAHGNFLKSAVLSLPLLYGVAKIACFVTGCCYGLPYSGPFAVTYPGRLHGTYFPVQIAETLVFVALFAVLVVLDRKKGGKGTGLRTVILCAATKFLLDFLRFDHVQHAVTKNQVISILFLAGALIVSFISVKKRKQKKEDPSGVM